MVGILGLGNGDKNWPSSYLADWQASCRSRLAESSDSGSPFGREDSDLGALADSNGTDPTEESPITVLILEQEGAGGV